MKKMTAEYTKLFEKFLSGELSEKDKSVFNENCKNNPSFQKRYEDYLTINNLLSTIEKKRIKLDDSMAISEFEKRSFKKKFQNPFDNKTNIHANKQLSIIWKIAAAIFIVTGSYQISKFSFNNFLKKEMRPIISEISGRCYSNGNLLKNGDSIENNLVQSGKKSSCIISFSKGKDNFSIQLFPETELVNAQHEKNNIWKLNIGKIHTSSNSLNIQILVKDNLISLDKSVALIEFEKGKLSVEALNGKIHVLQNSAYLFGANSKRTITKSEAKIFSEKFPQFFGEIKNEIEEGTGYVVKYNQNEISQKESILLEIETLMNPEKKEISDVALSEIDTFLKISGPKIQKSLSYIASTDFPNLNEKRKQIIQEELVALIIPESKVKSAISKFKKNNTNTNEFKDEETEYYRIAKESLDKKPSLIFSLNLKDSTSIIGELSGKDGLYIVKTSEGKNMEIKREEVAFIELK